ncbi:hypothetical protein DYB25_008908 [Aphanomyces astaci]|uniref:Uncharacterized protein n=1 Tax=Aphanomyces astaci TaxID=112090 RepID=A0A397ARW6_APHAT|nr:hypothetical protein DYB25_008908 [Aphanomyces astaci]RHY12163.1 hypothetical protein DYB36_009358 [Aphanomyces astaci]RHY65424.1 hypothetical protein DYB34_006760 [Aphanomyces astaci]
MVRKPSKEPVSSSSMPPGDLQPINTILFDPQKGEVDVASGHRRWVHDAIEKRLKKAMVTGCIDLSGPARSSLQDGNRTFQLHLLPSELYASVSRLTWAKQHLKKLFLTNNCLALLSPEIMHFRHLTVLGVGGNTLASLPTDLGALVNLEQLHAEKNQLSTLPDSLHQCTKLTHVSLSANAFSTFPVAVTKCPSLMHLSLSHNRITSVPVQIRHLTKLVELDLDHNRIGPSLPTEVGYLCRLELLGLAGNCLDSMPACLSHLKLSCLRFSGNRAPGYIVHDPLTGDVVEGQNTPVRFDGYMQLRHAFTVLCDATQAVSRQVEDLEGLTPTVLLNLENASHDRDKDNV